MNKEKGSGEPNKLKTFTQYHREQQGGGEDNRFKNLMKAVAAKKAGKKVGRPADELNSDPSRMSNPFIDINNPAKNIQKYGK